jgi:hypothetical protein
MLRVHRYLRVALAMLGVLFFGGVLASAQAFAAGREFSKSLPMPTGGFSEPWGIVVGTGGEVFVSNRGSNVVEVCSASGFVRNGFRGRSGNGQASPRGGR